MTVVVGFVVVRVVEPRLGKYDPTEAGDPEQAAATDEVASGSSKRAGCAGPGWPCWGCWPSSCSPRCRRARRCATRQRATSSARRPSCSSLLFIVMLCFFVPGVAYGTAVGKYKSANDVIAAVVKTFAGLGGLIFMLLMISQFIAYFNYSNLPAISPPRWPDGWARPAFRRSRCWSASSW
jgi:aminobenzoyl-glutamate transport protein